MHNENVGPLFKVTETFKTAAWAFLSVGPCVAAQVMCPRSQPWLGALPAAREGGSATSGLTPEALVQELQGAGAVPAIRLLGGAGPGGPVEAREGWGWQVVPGVVPVPDGCPLSTEVSVRSRVRNHPETLFLSPENLELAALCPPTSATAFSIERLSCLDWGRSRTPEKQCS